MRVLKPDTEADTLDAVRDAARSLTPLVIEGNGSKRALGRAVIADTVLKLSGLTGITMYEPAEMVFTARAGTALQEIEAVLATNGQCLGFEPGDCGPFWGLPKGTATIGGIAAAGISGPRRFAAGGARDHLLGFTAINGKGERFKAGGRVVKNVTGYDLPKLAAGSFGTLFVTTELTLRAVPRGSASTVLAIEGLEPVDGLRMLRQVAASPFDPTGLAYLPTAVAARFGSPALTLIRLEGQSEGVKAREGELCRTLAPDARALDPEHAANLFQRLANLDSLLATGTAVWRVSVPPTRAIEAVSLLDPGSWFGDWAGGLLWLEFEHARTDDRKRVHTIARKLGGHATLYRSPMLVDESEEVFPPLDPATLALTTQLKDAFDPARILNPGRMYKGV